MSVDIQRLEAERDSYKAKAEQRLEDFNRECALVREWMEKCAVIARERDFAKAQLENAMTLSGEAISDANALRADVERLRYENGLVLTESDSVVASVRCHITGDDAYTRGIVEREDAYGRLFAEAPKLLARAKILEDYASAFCDSIDARDFPPEMGERIHWNALRAERLADLRAVLEALR